MLSVVVPSKNVNNLAPCIASIRHYEPTMRIIVVDDGLDLGRLANHDECFLCANDPVLVVPGVKPFVFSRNVNAGIRAAGTDDVILCNDDALLCTDGGFSRMAHQWLLHPECGLIAASTNGGTVDQRQQAGGKVRYARPMVAFVCVFIPRQTLMTVGMLDEQFGVNAGQSGARGYGCDDDDFCHRVRAAGLKLGIFDGCFVDHRHLHSTFRDDPEHPADVILHEQVFRAKWGMSPRDNRWIEGEK